MPEALFKPNSRVRLKAEPARVGLIYGPPLLYAYRASRTHSEAYQFKPILKYLESPVPALLIADEVGLGKTIEAAMLYQELKARGPIRRVLVVCPAGLR